MPAAGFTSLLGFWLGGGGPSPFVVVVETPSLYPPVASSDQFVLYALPELTWNTQPVLNAAVRNTPLVSMKGGTQIERRNDNQYRRNNQRGDSFILHSSANAHVEFELRPTCYDDLIAAVMGSTIFQPAGLIGLTDVYVDGALQQFVVVSDVDWIALGVKPGMWLQTAGFYYAANNGVFQIVTVTHTALTVTAALVSESPSTTESNTLIVGFRIFHARSGHTPRSFFLEGQYNDADLFEQYSGMQPTSLSIDARPRGLFQGSLDFIGSHVVASTVSVLDQAYLCAAYHKPIFNTAAGVLSLQEGGIPLETPVTGFSFTIENGAEALPRLSDLTPYSVRLGPITVRGTMQVYFTSIALKQKYLLGTLTSFRIHLQSANGDVWVINFPHVTLLAGDTSVEGKERDVFVSLPWEATIDPIYEYIASIDFAPLNSFTYVPFSSGVPVPEYFRIRDQTGGFWHFWIDMAGDIGKALDASALVLLDDTPVNITSGTVPFWHQVTDELGGTWYLYPNTLGELIQDASPPAIGTGLVVGLGQQLTGVDHALYRVGAGSDGSATVETINVSWQGVPRVWYLWIDATDARVVSKLPPNYIPGFIALPVVTGTPPAYYVISDTVGNVPRYVSINTLGQVVVASSPPLGTGATFANGIEMLSQAFRLLYTLKVTSGAVVYQLSSSICGVPL